MKEALLLAVIFATFAFGFYVMKKIDDFIEKNNRLITSMDRMSSRCVRIASENPMFFDVIASTLEHYSNSNPYMDFRLSSSHAKRLLRLLSDGNIDLVLLSEDNAKDLSDPFGCTSISYCPNQKVVTTLGLTVENMDDTGQIIIVWNKAILSKDRDRVLFALENEYWG